MPHDWTSDPIRRQPQHFNIPLAQSNLTFPDFSPVPNVFCARVLIYKSQLNQKHSEESLTKNMSTDDFAYVTGNNTNLLHYRKIDEGSYGEVHEARNLSYDLD